MKIACRVGGSLKEDLKNTFLVFWGAGQGDKTRIVVGMAYSTSYFTNKIM